MVNFSPSWNSSPPSGLKFRCDYIESFSPGLSKIFPLKTFGFVEYSNTAPAQAHVSTRAEIVLRLHEVFQPSSPGWTFSARADEGVITWRISARLAGLRFHPGFWKRARILSPGRNLMYIITSFILRVFLLEPRLKSQPGKPGWNSQCNYLLNQ